jgi:hypothetical protein|tara:strand:+ start:377 stop:1009 length:633 start_codon:yes stop_codon:yes gene_type:complete
MAWELLVDDDRGLGVFTCNTADVAFGPLVSMHDNNVGQFYSWWSAVGLSDPRTMTDSEVHEAVYRWYGIQHEIKFEISLPNGKTFQGEFYPTDYINITGLYDDDVSEELSEEWEMDDWENTMKQIFLEREADMEGHEGPMGGWLSPSTIWDEDEKKYIPHPKQSGPKWRIIGIKNGYYRKYNSSWETWNWYQGGQLIHTGDKAPWDQDEE